MDKIAIGPKSVCLYCKFWDTRTKKCRRGKIVKDPVTEVCDDWRYCA